MSSSSTLSITVNGILYEMDVSGDPYLNPYTTLSDFLRRYTPHKDNKVACGEGGCGACTVALTYSDATTGQTETRPINACLALLFSLDGMSITTSEGIGNGQTGYSKIQTTLAEKSGTQCGYCSSGMSMLLYSYLQENDKPSEGQLERILDGNLCRCTGYRPILDTYKSFAATSGTQDAGSCLKTRCCKKQGLNVEIEDMAHLAPPAPAKKPPTRRQCYVKKGRAEKTDANATGTMIWQDVTSLDSLAYYMNHYSGMKVMLTVGATSLGVYRNYKADVFLSIGGISDLNTITSSASSGITIGSAVTIHDVIQYFESYQASSAHEGAHFPQFVRHLKRVAGYSIRCRASIGGNLCLTHQHQSDDDFFPSDVCILLMGLGATVTILDITSNQYTNYTMTEFFKNAMGSTRILVSINVPFGKKGELFMSYKIAIRQVMDHALVNAAMRVTLTTDKKGNTVIGSDNTIAIGGVFKRPSRMTATEGAIAGLNVTDISSFQSIAFSLRTSLASGVAPFGGRQSYRVQVAVNYFYKFLLYLQPTQSTTLARAEQDWMVRPVTKASQTYQSPTDGERPVSDAIPKIDGLTQTSGEACYTDDIPDPHGTVYCALVQAHQASATIDVIDPTVVNDVDGFVKYYSGAGFAKKAKSNCFGPFGDVGPLLIDKTVEVSGQAAGLVVARTELIARMCASMIENTITYKNVGTPVVTMAQALAQENPFFDSTYTYKRGDTDSSKFKSCNKHWSGTKSINAQFHFQLERHAVLVNPVESQYVIDVASQTVPGVQQVVAATLGIPRSDITVRTRRCGGAFGSKGTAPTYTAPLAAFVSQDLGIPVRLNLTFKQPFQMLGARPHYQMDYTVGTNSANQIEALKIDLYLLTGICDPDTQFETKKVCHNIDNCYNIPNFYCKGTMVKANLPSATSVRGPGWIQAILFMEMIIEDVAIELGVEANTLRKSMFYKNGDISLGGMTMKQVTVGPMFDKLLKQFDYDKRGLAVSTFNGANKFVKRGIAAMTCRFSVGWGPNYNSTIALYPDGTVCVSHGGIEVGQGINTKVAQAVAMKFGLDAKEMLAKIRILPCSTQVVSGSSNVTGGSITSELCVLSVMHTCDILNERLAPFKTGGSQTFADLLATADASGVNLTASGSTGIPAGDKHDRYNSWGVAAAEVEVDSLTGQFEVKRTDLIFDCGISMNPAIDVGQVEGGFVMGLGWFTQEIVSYDPTTGAMMEPGSWEYKPPAAYDIPEELNVTLLENSENSKGVLSSKAVGEPPVALGGAVMFALQHAVNAARVENGLSADFKVEKVPLTVDQIATTCATSISNYCL